MPEGSHWPYCFAPRCYLAPWKVILITFTRDRKEDVKDEKTESERDQWKECEGKQGMEKRRKEIMKWWTGQG